MRFTLRTDAVWHRKFAWLPVCVEVINGYEKYVWLEFYMRKWQDHYPIGWVVMRMGSSD